MKAIEQRAKEWSEHIVKNRPYIMINTVIYPTSKVTGLVDIMEKYYIKGATEQQAIDEEVRLKKSDDMTKAEYDRETAFADWYLKNGKGTPTYSDAIEWSRKQTIDEVCEWMTNFKNGNGEFPLYDFVGNLRKSMEE